MQDIKTRRGFDVSDFEASNCPCLLRAQFPWYTRAVVKLVNVLFLRKMLAQVDKTDLGIAYDVKVQ